jgi:hypothetical protein
MAIVPSGNRKFMKLQQAANPSGASPMKRDTVQQEEIPADGANAQESYNPFGNLQNTLQQQKDNPSAAPQVPGQEEVNDAVEGNDIAGKVGPNGVESPQEDKTDSAQVGNDFRAAYYQTMEKLGVPPRLFKHPQHADKFFHIDEEVIGRGEAKGFFVLPSKTQQKAISKEEAWNIAKQIGSRFGVTKMNFSYAPGDNYKFTFQVLVQDNSEMSGTSLDTLISGGKGGAGGGMPAAKAAYSKNSIIKESKTDIINALIKAGFGENNVS